MNYQGWAQQPTVPSKQPIRVCYLGHVTGNQPVRDQYFLIRSVAGAGHYRLREREWQNIEATFSKSIQTVFALTENNIRSESIVVIPFSY